MPGFIDMTLLVLVDLRTLPLLPLKSLTFLILSAAVPVIIVAGGGGGGLLGFMLMMLLVLLALDSSALDSPLDSFNDNKLFVLSVLYTDNVLIFGVVLTIWGALEADERE